MTGKIPAGKPRQKKPGESKCAEGGCGDFDEFLVSVKKSIGAGHVSKERKDFLLGKLRLKREALQRVVQQFTTKVEAVDEVMEMLRSLDDKAQ